jgi:fibronectin-binding autotransporter adhesin
LTMNLSGAVAYSGVISGGGSVVNQGGGTTILNGSNTYVGNTVVQSGKLALGTNAFIPNSAAIVIAGGATLDVSSQTNFTLNGSLLPNGQILAGSGTVSGAVTAAGASVITPGTNGVVGTLTISSNLTISGASVKLDVSNSTKDQLVVGGDLNLQSGNISILTSGSITNGIYRLINYSGNLLGDAGGLTVSFSGLNQSAALNTNTPNWIIIVVTSANPNNLGWQGTDGTNPSWWDVQTTLNWTNGSTPSVFAQNDNTLFDDTASTFTVDIRTAVTPTKVVVNSAANNYTFQTSLAGKISGNASLVKSNSSTLTILTTNDYSGATVIANGTLQVGNGSVGARLGTGSITNNANLIYDSPDSQIVGNNIVGNGSLTVQAGQVILSGNNNSTGAVTNYSGAILQLGLNGASGSLGAGNFDNEGGFIINRSDAPVVNNVISGAGNITNSGSGTVTLGGANTFTGTTVVNNGTLKLGNASALGAALLEMDGGATTAGALDLNGFNLTLASLSGANGSVLPQIRNNGGAGVNTLIVTVPANSTFPGLIADNTGSGGKIALVDLGPNTLTLSGANTYSGGTTVSVGGALTLASVAAAGSGWITLSNGTLTAAADFANTINVLPNTTNTLVGYNGQINVVLTNSGTLNISPPGAGTFTALAVWPNFGGRIVFTAGGAGLRLLAGSTGAAGAAWDMGTTGGNVFPRDGGTINMGSLTGDSSTVLGGSSLDGQTIYTMGALNQSTIFSGTINDGTGTSINKVGTGTQTLDGTLNYTGSTTVSAGVLAIGSVNNPGTSLDNSTNLVISSNAVLDVSGRSDGTLNLGNSFAQTLTGSGTINGSLLTTSMGATINPGDTIGTLSVTNTVDLEANSTVIFQWNSTNSQTSDKIAATSSITVNGGTLMVTNLGPDLVTGGVFHLFNQAIVGSGFTTISLPASNVLNTIQYAYQTNLMVDGTIKVLQGASPVATNSPVLTNNFSGGVLTFSWPADHLGWTLEVQTNSLSAGLGTNWTRIPATASVTTTNFLVNPTNGSVFYRLIYP